MHSYPTRVKPLFVALVGVGLLAGPFSQAAVCAPKANGPATASERTATHEVDQLLSEIIGEGRTAVAMGKAKALERFAPYVPDDIYVAKLEAAATKVKSPLVAFQLVRSAAGARLDERDFSHGKDGMQGPMAKQGCLTDWQIVGPFENPSMQGFHTRLGPETGQDGPYQGKMTKVDWRKNPDFDRLCTFDLDQTVEPSTAAVVYMATEIDAKHSGKAKLLLGADGAFEAWVDGKPVAYRDEDMGLAIDGEAWPIKLHRGKNQLLVKIASTGDGSLGLSARLVKPNLEPITDATSTAKWNGKAVDKVDKDALTPSDDGLAALAAKESAKDDADAVWAAWLWTQVEPLDASTPWRATGDRLLDLEKTKPDAVPARELAMSAELFEEQWKKLDILQKAHKLQPSDPWIAARLAGEYGSAITTKTRQQERKVLDKLLAEHPSFLPGYISLADWYSNRGFAEKALDVIESYDAPDKMSIPAYVGRLAYFTAQAGKRARAYALYRKMESISALHTAYAWKRASDLIAADNYDAALTIVHDQQQLVPWSLRWQLREANIMRAKGDMKGALAKIDALITQRPDDVNLLDHKAQLLVALDKKDDALSILDEAIALKPQNTKLREYKAFLEPSKSRFYEPWMVDDVRKLADATPKGAYNYDTIIDQTLVRVAPNGLSTKVVQRADRVLTSDGIDSARYTRINYTKGDEQVEVLGVRVYKPDGTVSEDYDQWRSGGTRKASTTYTDSAYINLRANNVDVGDVVEFRYRISEIANENFRGDYFGDISYVQNTIPVALARYVVQYPKGWHLYFRAPKLQHKRLDNTLPDGHKPANNVQITGFELHNVPPVHTDPGEPGYTDVYDYVMVSNKKSYNEIGHWWWNLIKEQLIVDDTIKQKVAELTKGLKTDAEKVRAIHTYVVRNTRYLHVGLGIHGWKPYRTTTCFRNRYGDCKDKASLQKVMLDAAGVPAKMVLVRTRQLGTVDKFPASMHIFNHAITYVPSMDLYLDGTAEYNGTTELTPMDQGAQAVIIDDGGNAKMVTLPIDQPKDNMLRQEMTVDLTGDEPVTEAHLVAYGQNAVYYRRSLEDADRRDEIFEKQLSNVYPGAKLISATYHNLGNLEKPVEISFKFKGGRLERTNQNRKFVFPYGAPKDLLSAYAKQASRTQDLTIRLPFLNHTTMHYRLPVQQGFARVPEDTKIDSKFGSVTINFTKQGNQLDVDVSYSLAVQRISAKDYPKFRQFVSEMTSALNETIGIGEEQ